MHKIPVSVLVVVHTAELDVLLLERARGPGYWQSVTGSLDREDELLERAALREVMEETGIDGAGARLTRWSVDYRFEIYARWRQRFAPGVLHNHEHLFSLMLPRRAAVALSPDEHLSFEWLPWRDAAAKCFSWSNRDAILMLGERAVIA
jgi:dihydroneopterin triphosphate diphosphatase